MATVQVRQAARRLPCVPPILQSVPMSRPRFLPDNFTLALIATVLLATFLPCSGQTAVVFEWVTNIGIGLLFFLHGAKLSRQAIIAGMTHWRLHLLVFACTFVMFPLLGLALKPALSPMVTPGCTSASCSSAPCRPRCNPPSPSPRWRAATCRQRYAALPCRACSAYSLPRCWSSCCSAPKARPATRWTPSARSPCNCWYPSSLARSYGAGSAPGWSATSRCCAMSTRARSCWWSTPPSAPR